MTSKTNAITTAAEVVRTRHAAARSGVMPKCIRLKTSWANAWPM